MKKILPVFNIGHFQRLNAGSDFYADTLAEHLKHYHFVNKAHKHDFFLVVLFTKGSGTHEVDFNTYKITPGALFFLSPGQTHNWTLSKDIEGLIFFHTQDFFERNIAGLRLKDYAFFSSVYNPPLLQLKRAAVLKIRPFFEEMITEYKNEWVMKEQKLASLINLLYVDLARIYQPGLLLKSEKYLSALRLFEDLLDKNFKTIKSPFEYAALMKITERHLNRITKSCLDKTPSELILDRLILEARRMLMHASASVSEVGEELGYLDNSYFSRLFKKRTGVTAKHFMAIYR